MRNAISICLYGSFISIELAKPFSYGFPVTMYAVNDVNVGDFLKRDQPTDLIYHIDSKEFCCLKFQALTICILNERVDDDQKTILPTNKYAILQAI